MLSDQQVERYSRQIILPQVGGKGQERLLRARLLVHASGPLHAAALHYLAAAGVGTLGVFTDADDAVLSTLAAAPAQERFDIFSRLNPDCSLVFHSATERQAPLTLVQDYDLVLSDSAVLHDTCYATRRPFVYAAVSDGEAAFMVCRGHDTDAPCLHCAPLRHTNHSATSPLAAIAALFVGAQIATEALKQVLSLTHSSPTKLLRFRLPEFDCREEIVEKSPQCSVCRPSSDC
jgi:adenylyltransferase/sulfurtransferase